MAAGEKAPIYVIGHKNPDTDSICSAIAYAELKNRLYGKGYCAARAGQINQETQYVLNFFQVPAPQYVADVMTDVRDIDIRKTEGVSGQISLKKAWNMMRALGVTTLPITEDHKLKGLITVGDIANAYMNVYDNSILSTAKTPYKNILEALDATMVLGDEDAYYEKGEVVIAAANPDVMEEYIHEGDMVILGNRYESQLCAIEMNAACIIVCMGAKVSKTIRKLAQENHCSIIVTPHDTFTVARMINQSMPISHFMRRDGLTTFKLTEKTEDIKGIMGQKRYREFPILDLDDNYIGMISRRNLLNLRKKQVILVDHNEASQTVDGINHAEVLEIIDHHRIGSLETSGPVYFRNQPVGCTATIVTQMYDEQGVEIRPQIAGLMLAAILSDTLMFRSPTCTPLDEKTARRLATIAGVDVEEFASEMFEAGEKLDGKTPEEVFLQDFKVFMCGDLRFGVAQGSYMTHKNLQAAQNLLMPYLEEARRKQNVEDLYMMLTEVPRKESVVIGTGRHAPEMLRAAFDREPEADGGWVLPGVISRKKQFIPAMMDAYQEL